MYGDNEELLGKWFKRTGKRDQIFLASKFGIQMEGMQFKGIDSSGEYCKKACEKSLKRLGVDYIDLCKLFNEAEVVVTNIIQITFIVSTLKHQLKRPYEHWLSCKRKSFYLPIGDL